MSAPPPSENIEDTRGRLLRAALAVFARRDFDAVSVRAIVDLAGANVSAVSYHFGGKQGLYLATAAYLAERLQMTLQPLLDDIGKRLPTCRRDDARQMLRMLIHGLLNNLMREDLADDAAGFVLREQLQPTAAFDVLFDRLMLPMQQTFQHLLVRLLPADEQPDQRQQILMTHALMGQILAFRTARTTALRRLGQAQLSARDVDEIAEQIFQLTLNAIKARTTGDANDE